MTELTHLTVAEQSVDVPDADTGVTTTNPVADLGGSPVPVSSSDSGYTYDSGAGEWTFSTSGTKTLTWSTPVSVGSVSDTTFSGTISQRIRLAPLVPAQPQDPEVVQAFCVNGDVVGPRIDLPTTDGIDYTIKGDVTPGATVTVRATPTEGHDIEVDPDSDWSGDRDGLFGMLEVTLDTVECDVPPVVDDGDASPASAVDGELPDTGLGQFIFAVGVLGALMLAAGAVILSVRRRIAS